MAFKYGKIKIFFNITIGICIMGIVSVVVLRFALSEESFNWMFEGILNFVNNGSFETGSSNRLQSMYFMPKKGTILYGDGYYTQSDGNYYMTTDIGFMRPLLFWGIFIEIVYYSILIPPLCVMLKRFKDVNVKFFVAIFVISLFIYELKGEMLLTASNLIFGIAGTVMMEKIPNVKFYSKAEKQR
jgi:uncharacterized membrane protein YhaH (DUF805 family)